jgi:NADPH-dependent glutamate synthase beta subunit-like oxidoreductase
VLAEQAAGRFDAVFIAIGTQLGKRIDIPARDAAQVFTAINVLHDAAAGLAPKLGRRVVVYGAGNTAMDAARTARRLGAAEAMIVFISDRAHMEAHAFEAEEALAEGITIQWLSSIHDIGRDAITVERMVLDADGRAQPTGEMETLAADSVVLALGQRADSGFLKGIPGLVIGDNGNLCVDAAMMTGHAGIFAGGDMVSSERSVTAAVGGGKDAARHIDAWLRGATLEAPPARPGVSFDMLHLPIYAEAPLARQHELAVAERLGSFVETTAGLAEAAARHEAKRCLSCGNCYACDQCFAACPEEAIRQLGPGYAVDLDHCTGCGICFEQCPCHAIDMVQEARA